MGSQTSLAKQMHDQLNTDLVGLQSQQVKDLVNFQMSTAIAYALALPATSSVNETELARIWETKHSRPVMKFLDEINREFVIDYSTITRMTQAIWVFRQRLAYEPCYLHASLSNALCAARILPSEVIDTLTQVGVTDSSGVSRLFASEGGMSFIESKRRQIEKAFKTSAGVNECIAGNEDHGSLGKMLRTAKLSTIAASLESLDNGNLSEGEQTAIMARLNSQLDHELTKGRRIDAIRSHIVKHGKITRKTVAALESIDPGIIYKHPKASKVAYTNHESTIGVVAALEAIDWKKMGKWGIIGAIAAAITYIVGQIIRAVFLMRKLGKRLEMQRPEDALEYMEAFGEVYKQGKAGVSFNDALDLADKYMRERNLDTGVPDLEKQKVRKNSVETALRGIPEKLRGLINVSPVPPSITPDADARLNDEIGHLFKSFAPDTKMKIKEIISLVYGSSTRPTEKELLDMLGNLDEVDNKHSAFIDEMLRVKKLGANRDTFHILYGDAAKARLKFAFKSIDFSNEFSDLVTDFFNGDISSLTAEGLYSATVERYKKCGFNGATEDLIDVVLPRSNIKMAPFSYTSVEGIRERAALLGKLSVDTSGMNKSFLNLRKYDYGIDMCRNVEAMQSIIDENQQTCKAPVFKVDKILKELASAEEVATSSKDVDNIERISKLRIAFTDLIDAVKSIDMAALEITISTKKAIDHHLADMATLIDIRMKTLELKIMSERDAAI